MSKEEIKKFVEEQFNDNVVKIIKKENTNKYYVFFNNGRIIVNSYLEDIKYEHMTIIEEKQYLPYCNLNNIYKLIILYKKKLKNVKNKAFKDFNEWVLNNYIEDYKILGGKREV